MCFYIFFLRTFAQYDKKMNILYNLYFMKKYKAYINKCNI